MKKNVCMIAYTHYLSDARVRREAETIASCPDYEVSILVLKETDKPKAYEVEGVKVIELNTIKYEEKGKFNLVFSYLKFIYQSFLKLNEMLFSRKLDVVHVHNMPNFLVFAALIPRLLGKKVILDIHDSTPETFFAKYGDGQKRFIYNILSFEEAVCCRFAHKLICVNYPQRNILVNRGIPAKKITISMNLPDPKWFNLVEKTGQTKNKHNKFRIIYHGTISNRLGVDLAIRACAKLAKNNPDIELNILGGGDGLQECTDLVKKLGCDNVVHINNNMIPLEGLLSYLEDMDLGIVPNRKNMATELMLPVKLLEYVTLGIPVVASRLPAIEYYFTPDMVSYFEPEDLESMMNAILNLYKNEWRRREIAENAKSFVKKYNWPDQRQDLINLYFNL
jgi:glycosyltransferase involved in cell wall biosynthesis